ncbi:MAG: AAA family ATPase [Lachnoanaerobaculum gingivalis]|jgi:ATP-dependent metallopeptidase hflB4
MSEFDKIIGYADIKDELIRFCDVLKNFKEYNLLGIEIPRGILLYGEPGIGKTILAKSFIRESEVKSFTIRKNKHGGEFVNHIRNTFDKAKKEECAIVFLDDMDKFANEDEYHKDAEEYVVVQSCIDDCKGSNVFVLATANNIYCLPNSLMRAGRFDKVIQMTCPGGDDAKKIIKHFLSKKRVLGDIDIDDISSFLAGHSCAELEMVINEAGIYAVFDKRAKIEQRDIIKACMRLIFDASESVEYIDSNILKKVAVHESGHAVISEILEPGSVNLVSICGYSNNSGGITSVRKPDDYNFNVVAQENEVIRSLGGKAATEMIYGTFDLGCIDDLQRALDLVTTFVDNYCAYGFDAFEGCNPSQYLLESKDRKVAKEMDRYYRKSKQIIAENRGFFDAMVQELLKEKTLTKKQIRSIRDSVMIRA